MICTLDHTYPLSCFLTSLLATCRCLERLQAYSSQQWFCLCTVACYYAECTYIYARLMYHVTECWPDWPLMGICKPLNMHELLLHGCLVAQNTCETCNQ